jgi:hypothetical protein
VPYVVVLVVVHLLIAHLLWRLMLRLGVDALLATVLAAAFAVLGAGAENLLLAWQVQLIAPLATGIGALLIAPDDGPLGRRDAWVSVLLLVGLMCSGVGVTMLAVVALVTLLRRGWKPMLATIAVPVAAYAIWYVAYGRDTLAHNRDSLSTAAQKLPEYVWRGLTDAVDATFGLDGIAPALLAGLAVWLVLRARAKDARWEIPLVMAAGALMFLGLTALRRSGLGIDSAGGSRYVYVVVALLLPAGALALDALLARSSLRLPAIALLAALLFAVQVPRLNRASEHWAVIDQSAKSRVLGTAALAKAGEDFAIDVPVGKYMPSLTVAKIVELADDGKLPDEPVTERQELDARLYTQVVVTRSSRGSPGAVPTLARADDASVERGRSATCRRVVPTGDHPGVLLRFVREGSVTIEQGSSEPIRLSLWGDTAVSETRTIDAFPDVPVTVHVPGGYGLGVGTSREGVTQLCPVAVGQPSTQR